MNEQRNLMLAVVLSVLIIMGFQLFYEAPRLREAQERAQAIEESQTTTAVQTVDPGAAPQGLTLGEDGRIIQGVSRERAIQESGARISLDNGRITGSIALQGGRINDISLNDYRESLDENSENIILFSPSNAADGYFADFGWVAESPDVEVPGRESVWQSDSETLSATSPVNMAWDNGSGLEFARKIEIDDNYMFHFERRVTNTSDQAVTLFPYGRIRRNNTPTISGFFILHEGPIGVFDETLTEVDYSDLQDDGPQKFESTGGWLGIGDKYWMATLVPDQTQSYTATFQHEIRNGGDRYQTDYLREGMIIEPGQSITVTDRLYAGAKEVDLLDGYSAEFGVPLFDRAVDFGWFYFLTKPFFHILSFLFDWVGNYGVAILILTLLIKLVFFPLANKSYVSMSKMKKLQPEMEKIKEKAGDNREQLQKEMMELYRKEKVNPAAGCLPILIQIPVFFALYKVLFVSIEMRHAPFFGWIKDLSAPDPTSMFNLFGLLPFGVPDFLVIGVWPIIMAATMYFQQKLNPAPPDPMQARIMSLLPLIFLFLFASFPAGLVIYWAWNNVLSIGQQWLIMKKLGVKPG